MQNACELDVVLKREVREPAMRKDQQVDEHTTAEEQHRPSPSVRDQSGASRPLFHASSRRDYQRDAHNEEEALEDRVREGPPVPLGVHELGYMPPGAPGLLTRTIDAMVAPRKRSRDSSRFDCGDDIGPMLP
jgi:hypothetical protein